MPENIEGELNPERRKEIFQELFRGGRWLEAIRYAIENGVPLAHEDPEDIPLEDRWSVNEAIRKIMEAQDRAKEVEDRAEFERLEEEYRQILFAIFPHDPQFAEEEYEQTKRSFDDEQGENQ